MVEVEACPPQRNPRQSIELGAAGAFWKNGARDRDMALENAREPVPHHGGRLAHRESARDVGRAILILAAGIDQKYAFADFRVGLNRYPVMRNGGIGAGSGDRWK